MSQSKREIKKGIKTFFSKSPKKPKKQQQPILLDETAKAQTESQCYLEKLQQRIQEITGLINAIVPQLEELKEHYNNLLDVFSKKEQRRIEGQISELTQQVYQQAKKLIVLFKELQADGTQNSLADETTQKQINHCLERYKEFQELWRDFYEAQDKFAKEVMKYNRNYFFLLHPDATEDELKRVQMLMISEISKTATLTSQPKTASEALNFVTTRYEEIRDLSKKLSEVECLFVDFALLIQNQTESVNAIQNNIATAKQSVVEGNQALRL